MDTKTTKRLWILTTVFSLALLSITPRESFYTLLFLYALSFTGFLFLIRSKFSFSSLFFIGLLLRVPFLFAPPLLSDDIFRFFWDGHLFHSLINPYSFIPAEIFPTQWVPNANLILAQMNSPNYYTVYPPLNQLFFAFPTLFTNSFWWYTIILKTIFIVTDLLAVIALKSILKSYKIHPSKAHWYFLHPLLIIEGVGNLHFEGVMMGCLIIGIYFIHIQKNRFVGMLGWVAAASIKLYSLIWIPLLFKKRIKHHKSIMYCAFIITMVAFTFFPFYNNILVQNIKTSLGLYFQTFEFNASVYFLVREIGYWLTGYNQIQIIGAVLPFATISLIFWQWKQYYTGKINTPAIGEAIILIYLIFSTTVHPWYLIMVLPMLAFTQNIVTLMWSFTIFLSYRFYSNPESTWWLWMEYVPIFILLLYRIYEKRTNFNISKNLSVTG